MRNKNATTKRADETDDGLTEMISVPVTPTLKRELEEAAKRDDRSTASLVRQFTKDGLSRSQAVAS